MWQYVVSSKKPTPSSKLPFASCLNCSLLKNNKDNMFKLSSYTAHWLPPCSHSAQGPWVCHNTTSPLSSPHLPLLRARFTGFCVDQRSIGQNFAVFGNDESPLVISTPDGIFNSPMNASWNASGVNPAFFPFFPDLQDDSFAPSVGRSCRSW